MRNEFDLQNFSSKRKLWGSIYDIVNRVAYPGDVLFFISRSTDLASSRLRRMYRSWQGVADEDNTVWHTAIYVGPKKESSGSQVRPRIVHAATRGVEEIHLSPSYFSSERTAAGEVVKNGRIEIIQNPEITEDQRGKIVQYARSQLGKPFDNLGWKHDVLTYAFGLPARELNSQRVSCHGLAFDAYGHVGLSFPHQLGNVPFLNLGRYRGHPLGHPPDRVNLRRLYLRDHHLYQDPRFHVILSISEDNQSGGWQVVENPGKYSWNPSLQKRFCQMLGSVGSLGQ